MPLKALSCVVDVDIHAVSSPGTRLARLDDISVSVRLFGEVRKTRLVSPFFPLIFHDKLRFSKVFYTAYEPSQVAEALEDSMVRIDLIQESDIYSSGRLLAWYDSSARKFLYPSPSYLPSYGLHDRELLMDRSVIFPGISPKLEFSTKTVLREVLTPLVDPSDLKEDFMANGSTGRHSRRRSRSRSISRATVSSAYRSRSLSPRRRARSISPSLHNRLKDLGIDGGSDSYRIDDRPPFVVRKVDTDLIHRKPAPESTIGLDRLPIERGRQKSLSASAPNGSNGVRTCYSKADAQNYSTADDYDDGGSDDDDDDVEDDDDDDVAAYAALEAESDFLLRERMRQALRRSRHRQRLNRLLDYQRHLRSTLYHNSLDDLELDLELARLRRYYSLYP